MSGFVQVSGEWLRAEDVVIIEPFNDESGTEYRYGFKVRLRHSAADLITREVVSRTQRVGSGPEALAYQEECRAERDLRLTELMQQIGRLSRG